MYILKNLPKTQQGLINLLFKNKSPLNREYFEYILDLVLKSPKKILERHYNFYLENYKNIKEISTKKRWIKSLGISNENTRIDYYIDRGFEVEEAKIELSKRQRTWEIERIMEKNMVNADDANILLNGYKKKISLKNKEYYKNNPHLKEKYGNAWLRHIEREINTETNKEYTRIEAIEKRGELLKEIREKIDFSKINYCSRRSYWIKKGFNEYQASDIIAKKFICSLDTLIAKYGETEGFERWKAKTEKWKKTMDSKSDSEKIRILEAKTRFSKRYSKNSVKFFNDLISSVLIKYPEFKEKCYFGESEYFIKYDKGIYFYDFCILSLNLIIEFNGIRFHPKPNLTEEEKLKWICPISKRNYLQVKTRDEKKEILAKKMGFHFYIIWEDEDLNKIRETYATLIVKLLNK